MKKSLEIQLVTLHHGSCRRIVAIVTGNENPVADFLSDLKRDAPNEFDVVVGRMHAVAERDRMHNPITFKSVGDSIYEMKTKGGVRLYCFYHEDYLVIATNGGRKGTKKNQNRDIRAAKAHRESFRTALAKKNPVTLIYAKNENRSPESI